MSLKRQLAAQQLRVIEQSAVVHQHHDGRGPSFAASVIVWRQRTATTIEAAS